MHTKFTLIALLIFQMPSFLFSSGSTENEKEIKSVDIMWWGDIERHERTLKILDRYEKINRSIIFNPVYSPWKTYWDRLYSLIAADEIPDVYQMVVERLPLFSEKDLLMNLYDVESIDLNGIDRKLLEAAEIEGELKGLPLGVNALALAYNPAIFDELDLSHPEDDWTWEDLYAAGRDISSGLGIYGMDTLSSNNVFFYYIRARGYSVFNEELNGPGWKKEIAEDWFDIILRFQDAKIIPPPEKWINNQASEENSLYAKEQAAMKIMWSNRLISVSEHMNSPSMLALPPGPGAEYGLSLRPSLLFSISRSSKNSESIGRFLTYFVNDLEVNRLQNNDRGIPVVLDVRHAIKDTANIQSLMIYEYIDKVTKIIQSETTGYPLREGEFREFYDEVIRRVRFEMITPEEAAGRLWEGSFEVLDPQI